MKFYERIDATTSNLQPASTFSAKVDRMQFSLTQAFSSTPGNPKQIQDLNPEFPFYLPFKTETKWS